MRWIFVGAALAISGPASAQELWRGAVAGMSVDEVLAAVPDVREATGDGVASGALGAVAGPLRIANDRWQASFYFSDGNLSLVVLRPLDIDGGRAPHLFDPVLDDLREAYGEPFSCDHGQFGRDCEWRWPDKVVQISLTTVYGRNSLAISYRPRDPERPPL